MRSILRLPEVIRLVGLRRTAIFMLEKSGSFPERVKLTPTGTAVGWYSDEISAFIESRKRGSPPAPAKAIEAAAAKRKFPHLAPLEKQQKRGSEPK